MRRPQPQTSRRRRGSVIIFFIVFALPMLFIAAALAWDATRIEIARRQLDTATNSAAISAAWAVDPASAPNEKPRLDPALAESIALETYCMNWVYVLTVPSPMETDATRPTLWDCSNFTDSSAVANDWGVTVNTGETSVKVIGQAKVTGLILIRMVLPGTADPVVSSYATANVCAATSETGCARPFTAVP